MTQLTTGHSETVVHVLQVAAERRRKAATKPLSLADNAVAALEPGPSAAQSASAAEDGRLHGSSSSCAAEQGQQDQAQTEKADAMTPKSTHNSSPPNCIEKRLDHPEAGTAEQLGVDDTQSVPPTLESNNEAEEAHKDHNCNGFHEKADENPSQQEDGNPTKSTDRQQPAKEITEAAAAQAAAQERQQRLVQSLIEGCDELADDHQQVCMSLGAQQQDIQALP